MKFLLLLALCVATTLAVPLSQSHPVTFKDLYARSPRKSLDPRIIGGSPAVLGQFSWQASVYISTPSGTWFCGGSIISDEWILTAAHCAQGGTQFVLNVGGITTNDYESGRITLYSNTAIVHPGYSTSTLNNDIALIRLNQPLSFSDRVSAVQLPQRGDVTGAGLAVTVSGWGLTSDTANYISEILNYVQLTTISNAACASVYGSAVIIESTICAVGNPYHSTCSGDSGGPLVDFGSDGVATQIGVVSFVSAAGCASGNPSGYVRTESFLDWIAAQTGLDV